MLNTPLSSTNTGFGTYIMIVRVESDWIYVIGTRGESDAWVQENKKLKHELDEYRMAVFGLERKCELLEYDNSKL